MRLKKPSLLRRSERINKKRNKNIKISSYSGFERSSASDDATAEEREGEDDAFAGGEAGERAVVFDAGVDEDDDEMRELLSDRLFLSSPISLLTLPTSVLNLLCERESDNQTSKRRKFETFE